MFEPESTPSSMDGWDTAYLFVVLPLAYSQGGMDWLFLAGIGFFVQSFLRKVPLSLPQDLNPQELKGVFTSKPSSLPQLPAKITMASTPEVHTWTRDAERSL